MPYNINKKLSNILIYHMIVLLVICSIFSNHAFASDVITATSFDTAINIALDSKSSNVLTNENSISYYKVTLDAAGKFTVNLRSFLNNEVKVDIYDSNRELMKSGSCIYDNVNKNGVYSDSNYLEAGVYYICLKKVFADGTGAFDLTTTFKKSTTYDKEPNNDITKAQAVPMQKSISGLITASDRVDYYYVDINNEENLTVNLTPKFESKISVSIMDKDGNKIETGTASYIKATNTTLSYTYKNTSPKGRYYIVVQTLDNTSTGVYSLKVSGFVRITNLSLSPTYLVLHKGSSKTIKVVKVPSNATEGYSYKSSNKSVAKISSKGKITALKLGKATISVTSANGVVRKCLVKVTKIPVSSVKLSVVKKTLKVGKTFTLKASISPKTATYKAVKWVSSNKKIAIVNSKGKVKALRKGTALITVISKDGSHKRTCVVHVVKPVTSVTLNKKHSTMYVGHTFILKASVKPSNASNKKVTYRTSNSNIATVNSRGKVTAKNPGTALITVTTKEGKKKASCRIVVKQKIVIVKPTPTLEPNSPTTPKIPEKHDNNDSKNKIKVTSIYVSGFSLAVGESRKLNVSISPSNAENKKFTYRSSNSKVAIVSSRGVVKAISKGTVTITVTSSDGVSNFCSIVVR